jgi:hypothetical protein
MRWRLPLLLFLSVPLAQCAPVEERDSGAPESLRDSGSPESLKASVRRQVEERWFVDLDTPGLEQMMVRMAVEMNPDGSVQFVRIDPSSNNGDPNWPRFAEGCRRAVLKSSPLTMPSSVPYEKWKRMTLVFSAKDMLSQGN